MKKCVVWGTGKKAEQNFRGFLLASLNKNIEIIGFIDSNSYKQNSTFYGINIYAPADISKLDYDFIDIWVINGYEDIKAQINAMGIHDKIMSVFQPFVQTLSDKYAAASDAEIKSFLAIMEQQKNPCVYAYNPVKQDELREAFYDERKGLYYVFFEGKRLYLANKYKFKINKGRKYASNLWQEQDPNSPHLYEENEVTVEEGDVLVDAGACEGNFSLHNIDKVSKLYLIECDADWLEALRATFEPYKDKVVFCNKFLSDHNTDTAISLNSLVKEPVNFIKMDIEGEEVNALKGSDRVFAGSSNIKCSICSYHRHGDEEKIRAILQEYGLTTVTSKGYMLFIYDDEVWKNPELRRGIVRGKKSLDNSEELIDECNKYYK